MKKKLLSYVLLMFLLLTASSAIAADVSADILQKDIAAIELELKPMYKELTYIKGIVSETTPTFIVAAKGLNVETFFESNPHYWVKNPEDGLRLLDLYYGWHKYEGKTTTSTGLTVTIVGPASNRFYELRATLDQKQALLKQKTEADAATAEQTELELARAKFTADNKAQGNDTIYYPDNSCYVGKTQNGVPHGQGILYWADGTAEYSGEFTNGKKMALGGAMCTTRGCLVFLSMEASSHSHC